MLTGTRFLVARTSSGSPKCAQPTENLSLCISMLPHLTALWTRLLSSITPRSQITIVRRAYLDRPHG
jgi:hypothetical protein